MQNSLFARREAVARRASRAWALVLLPLAAACVDRSPTLPPVQPVDLNAVPVAECTYTAATRSLTCTDARPQGSAQKSGARGDKILGGQDVYVRLTSSNTSYDSGTGVLTSDVTVQNLLQQSIGKADSAVKVFFASGPTRTGGTGEVYLLNADSAMFTASNQKYFSYAQILTPYEISNAKTWQFHMDATVTAFVFTVYVSAPLADYGASLLDRVWTGAADSAWSNGANWQNGSPPDSASTVSIPADSLLASHRSPVLDVDGVLSNLRVGYGSTLKLNSHTLVAWGNVDAVGTVSGGTLWMRGSGAVVGGSVGAVLVSGSSSLQRSTVASGAVAVTGGSLAVKDKALSISIP